MDSNSSVAIMFVAAFSAIAFVAGRLFDYRLKSRIIKSGLIDTETIRLLNQLNGDTKLKALKWVLLLFFSGLGLIFLQFIPYDLNSPLPYGIEAVFVAIGFFIYYRLISNRSDN